MLLVSQADAPAYGGIPVVSRLIMDAARAAAIPGTVVSLHDGAAADWRGAWPNGYGAGGSALRFAIGAIARRRHAADDVVLVTHVGLAPVGRTVKTLTGARLVVFLHGVEAWRSTRRLTSWGLRAADAFIANSRFTLTGFREAHRALASIPGEVCYLPARTLAPRDTGQHQAPATLRVVTVGRLWGRGLEKGQRQLIDVWPRVVSEYPGAQLVIVGSGDGGAELERRAADRGVAGDVRVRGPVSDGELDALYRTSHVFAMPSRGEGFGLVFAEAMARGLPCIASRLDAGSEVVLHGQTGLHVDPDDEDELLVALGTLLGDAALRATMGAAGARRAADLFSLDAFERRIVAVLRSRGRPEPARTAGAAVR
jgi:phosphatidylinositol alpha-1,6-mannosyltransferase